MSSFTFSDLTQQGHKFTGTIRDAKWLLLATATLAYATHSDIKAVDAAFKPMFAVWSDKSGTARYLRSCRDFAIAQADRIAEVQQGKANLAGITVMVSRIIMASCGTSLVAFRDQGKRTPQTKDETTPGSAASEATTTSMDMAEFNAKANEPDTVGERAAALAPDYSTPVLSINTALAYLLREADNLTTEHLKLMASIIAAKKASVKKVA